MYWIKCHIISVFFQQELGPSYSVAETTLAVRRTTYCLVTVGLGTGSSVHPVVYELKLKSFDLAKTESSYALSGRPIKVRLGYSNGQYGMCPCPVNDRNVVHIQTHQSIVR